MITNHALIREYRLGFFHVEIILLRQEHTFYIGIYNIGGLGTLKEKSLVDIITFLEFNLGVFYFQEGII